MKSAAAPEATVLNGVTINIPRDYVAALLGGDRTEWLLETDGGARHIPIGELDALLWSAVRQALHTRVSLCIAVPRVQPGVVLGPALGLAVSAVFRHVGILPSHKAAQLRAGERIAIATRQLRVRDMLAESCVHGNDNLRMCAFPTSRLTRTGELRSGFYGGLPKGKRPKELFESSAHFELYDLATLPANIHWHPCRIVLAELYEHDGVDYIARLQRFIAGVEAASAIVFISECDVSKLDYLSSAGFEVLNLHANAPSADASLPSLASINSMAHASVEYSVRFIADLNPQALALYDAHLQLRAALDSCAGGGPRFLSDAWRCLDALSCAAAPIAALERARKAIGRKTLAWELEKLREPRVLAGENHLAQILRPAWSHVIDALDAAYESLKIENPFSNELIDRILYAEPGVVVALNDVAAMTALKSELLLEYGWSSNEVLIDHLSELSRNRVCADRVIAVGIDGNHRKANALWSLLPRCVDVVTYPHLQKRHERWLAGLDDRLQREHSLTRNTAEKLWPGTVQNNELLPLKIVGDISSTNHAAIQATLRERQNRKWSFAEPLSTDISEDGVWSTAENDEETSVLDEEDTLVVIFVDGHEHRFPVSAEVLVLDGDEAIPRLVRNLKSGETVIYLAVGQEQRSAFQVIRDRTRDLVDVDDRALRRWSETLLILRNKYEYADVAQRRAFVSAARSAGASKGDAAIEGWLLETRIAPRDQPDVCALLTLAGNTSARELAAAIHPEINKLRAFNRRLGKRIRYRLSGASRTDHDDAVLTAIDEFLEQTETREVLEVVFEL